MPRLPKRHSGIDEVSRAILVIGAIGLLVANLIPVAGVRAVLLVAGGILAVGGIVGMGVAMLVGSRAGRTSR